MRHSSKTADGKGQARKQPNRAIPFSASEAADLDGRTPFKILAY